MPVRWNSADAHKLIIRDSTRRRPLHLQKDSPRLKPEMESVSLEIDRLRQCNSMEQEAAVMLTQGRVMPCQQPICCRGRGFRMESVDILKDESQGRGRKKRGEDRENKPISPLHPITPDYLFTPILRESSGRVGMQLFPNGVNELHRQGRTSNIPTGARHACKPAHMRRDAHLQVVGVRARAKA